MMRFISTVGITLLATSAVAQAQPAPGEAAGSGRPDAVAPRSAAVTDAELAVIDEANAKVSDFDKLRTPDSPAFVILGVSPTEIQRPTTPRSFIASLGGFVTEAGLAVPRDLALEVAPYWLLPHPDLSITNYRRERWALPMRTLSISIGTAQTTRTEAGEAGAMIEHIDSDIGIGFRTMLFQAGGSDECTRTAGIAISQAALLSPDERTQLLAAGSPGSDKYNEAQAKLIEGKVAGIDTKLRTEKCVALVTATTGFSIDLAGAIDVRADDSKLTGAATSIAAYSLWSDVSYDTEAFSGIALARLSSRDQEMGTAKVLDAGARGVYKAKSYGISVEALLRRRFANAGDDTTYKIDVALEYKVSDDSWLSLTLGKDFATVPGDAGSWFSLANVQWSLGKPKL